MSTTIPCRVSGIPCQARLDSYSPFYDGRKGHIDSWLPDEPEEIEFHLLDRKGYAAPWLERKLTPADISRIGEALVEALMDTLHQEEDDSREVF